MGHFILIDKGADARYEAWLEVPASGNANGVGLILIPEVYNVNAWARTTARRYADAGFTVLVADLYWRQEPGVHLDYDQPERARALGAAIDEDGVLADVGLSARYLRDLLGARARIGVVGFCLGGRLALRAALREPLDGVVSYYGVKLEAHLAELEQLRTPALLHFGAEDPWVPADALARIQEALRGKGNVDIRVYQGAGHGFARQGYGPHEPTADASAFADTVTLLKGRA